MRVRSLLILLALLCPSLVMAIGPVHFLNRMLPDFELLMNNGEKLNSSKLKGNATVLLYVDEQQPISVELMEDVAQHAGKRDKLNVFAISRKSLVGTPPPFPTAVDSEGELYDSWRIRVYPVVVFLDSGGVVSAVFNGYTRTERERLKGEIGVITGEMTRDELTAEMEMPNAPLEAVPAEELVHLGQRHWEEGFPDRARETWEEALRRNPKLMDAHLSLLRYAYTVNDSTLAEKHLTPLLSNSPDAETWQLAGRLRLRNGDLDRAEEAAENALDLNRRSSDAKLLLAEVYLGRGMLEDSEQLAGDVLILEKQNAHALYLLARVAEQRGDKDKALAFYRQAFELMNAGW